MTAQLEVTGLSKRFGGFTALSGIEFAARAGERIGIIGPNGSGKSTFVNCLAGALTPDEGSIRFKDEDIVRWPAHRRAWTGLARTFQLPKPFGSLTVLDNVCVSLIDLGRPRSERAVGRDIAAEALSALARVGIDGKAGALPKQLTQVELRKLELAKAIAMTPDLLIADEAMAGLSHTEVDEILALLFDINRRGTTVIMIEHIIRAVSQFSERLMVLVAGKKIADGEPDAVLAMPEVEHAYLGR